MNHLSNCYQLVHDHGIQYGAREFILTPKNLSTFVKELMKKPESLEQVLKEGGEDFLLSGLKWLASINSKGLIEQLSKISKDQLSHLTSAVNLSTLKKAYE